MSGELSVPEKEFETRVARTKKILVEKGLDALLAVSGYAEREGHVCYLTNHHSSFPFSAWDGYRKGLGYSAVLLPSDGSSLLIMPMDYQKDALIGVESVKVEANLAAGIVGCLKEKKLLGKKIGVAGMDILPAGLYKEICQSTPETAFVEANEVLEAQRMIKSDVELKLLRESARIADIGLEAGLNAVVDGVAEYKVGLAAAEAAMEAGADYIVRTRVHSGVWTAKPRWPVATHKKIRKGEMVTLDLIGWRKNYAFDVFRATVAGKPTEQQKKLLEAGAKVTEAQIKSIKPGVTAEETCSAVTQLLTELGYKQHMRQFGHGIGIDVVENPYTLPGNKTELKTNMVLCLEPGITIPELGSVRIEDEVIVTESGTELISHCPRIPW